MFTFHSGDSNLIGWNCSQNIGNFKLFPSHYNIQERKRRWRGRERYFHWFSRFILVLLLVYIPKGWPWTWITEDLVSCSVQWGCFTSLPALLWALNIWVWNIWLESEKWGKDLHQIGLPLQNCLVGINTIIVKKLNSWGYYTK